jgi:hypothetical protein
LGLNKRLVHGVALLAITLAVVGAVGSSTEWEDERANGLEPHRAALESALPRFESAVLATPIRSGRLADQVEDAVLEPIVVRVAGIALEAPVTPVGVDADHQFAVPAADTVGWYRYGASPGTPGAAVLAAHVDYGGRPGAFFNLREVLPGDTLEVEMQDGAVIAYRVTGNTVYDKAELPAEELFRKDGSSVLQLITCGGTFDPAARSYEANLVVTAVPIAR